MRKFVGAVFCIGLGAVLMTCAFGLHFIQSPTGFSVIWKSRPSLKDVYVDVRRWKRDEWKNHPDLVKALHEAGKSDVVPKTTRENPVRDLWRNLTDGKTHRAGDGKRRSD